MKLSVDTYLLEYKAYAKNTLYSKDWRLWVSETQEEAMTTFNELIMNIRFLTADRVEATLLKRGGHIVTSRTIVSKQRGIEDGESFVIF